MTVRIPYAWSRGDVSARLEFDDETHIYTPYLNVLGREIVGPTSYDLPMQGTRDVRRMCSTLACKLAELGDDALLEFWDPAEAERERRAHAEMERMRKDREQVRRSEAFRRVQRQINANNKKRRKEERKEFDAIRDEIALNGGDASRNPDDVRGERLRINSEEYPQLVTPRVSREYEEFVGGSARHVSQSELDQWLDELDDELDRWASEGPSDADLAEIEDEFGDELSEFGEVADAATSRLDRYRGVPSAETPSEEPEAPSEGFEEL